MRPCLPLVSVVVACVTVFAASSADAAEVPELKLEPCTIELVNGTEVEGKLAVQFEMDEHLIVYSPRLATVRSFLKKHVHALTVDGKRKQLNAKRALTEADKKLLGQVDWPAEPKDEGFKPDYTTETWAAPEQLLVWAHPGQSGHFEVPSNWLANGQRLQGEVNIKAGGGYGKPTGDAVVGGEQVDFLVPVFETEGGRPYQVRRGGGRSGLYTSRHITVECHAKLDHNNKGVYGNIWISPDGAFHGGGGMPFRGVKNTFTRAGTVRQPGEPVDLASVAGPTLARKWEVKKDDPEASMELVGVAGAGDDTYAHRGRLIISEGSTVLFGPRDIFNVREEAVLQLQSSAAFLMRTNATRRPCLVVFDGGTLRVGAPGRPIEHDAYIGLGFKDRGRELREPGRLSKDVFSGNALPSAVFAPGATVQMYSADPAKARLVFQYHGREGDGRKPIPHKTKDPERHAIYLNIPRYVGVVFLGNVELNGVMFNHFHKGGIQLKHPDNRDKWRNVFFGPDNESGPDELFKKVDPEEIDLQRHKDTRKGKWGA